MGTATNELDQMKNTEKTAWEGFNGRLWKSEINVRDFIKRTIHLMKALPISWLSQRKLPTNYGANYKNFKNKNVRMAAY